MSTPIAEVLSENDQSILFAALAMYEKHCRKIGKADISGSGKATEIAKSERWADKAQEVAALSSKLATELT